MLYKLIQNFDSSSKYFVYECNSSGKKFKIGEISGNRFYDLDRNGKHLDTGIPFQNKSNFWNQFNSVTVEKVSLPLGGYEPIAWITYWIILFGLTCVLVMISQNISGQVFWIITSIIHFAITWKFRYSKILVYWMALVSIIVLIMIFIAASYSKKN